MAMTYTRWMRETASTFHARSPELKAVDAALKDYDAAVASSGGALTQKRALELALTRWKDAQTAKKQDWSKSVRNKSGAVKELNDQLGVVIGGRGAVNSRGELMIDPAEAAARRAISNAIKQNTRLMFSGTKLTIKTGSVLADLNTVRGAMASFRTAAGQVRSATAGVVAPSLRQQIQSTLVSLFGDAPATEVAEALGGTFGEFLTNVTPFVGTIKSGAQGLIKWAQAAKTLYDRSTIEDARTAFAPGDPAAAFDAIMLIQTRAAQAFAATASIRTASAVAKGAFTALDLGAISGPTLGAAETLALLVQQIYLFARDWREMKAVNAILARDVIDLHVFRASPLLGCYLIGNSDTSAIINMAVGDYGRPGWTLQVEMMVRKAQPVFVKAREIIRGSRFEIAALQGMKGAALNRKATTLGLPTGRLDGAIDDISNKVRKTFMG